MKVIKTPKGPEPYQFSCKVCSATLEAVPSDIRHRGMDRNEAYVVFRCPCCQKDNYVDLSVLPRGW